MKKFSLILNNYIFFILSMLVYLIVISILGHFSLFSYKVVSVISYVFIVILFFITESSGNSLYLFIIVS